MSIDVDLVIIFAAVANLSASKDQLEDYVQKAEEQYSRLFDRLSTAGLQVVSRQGQSPSQILVFVKCPEKLLRKLRSRERCVMSVSSTTTNRMT